MARQYFGTDGVRGKYGGTLINESFAARLGAAAGRWLKSKGVAAAPVLIGRDTRFSGESLARAVGSGLAAEGWPVHFLGVLPTPAIARAVRKSGAALGVVLTASHNPAGDNGIKFFGSDGRKLTDADEEKIESLLPLPGWSASPQRAEPVPGTEENSQARSDYIAAAAALLAPESLRGWRIVLDTANGAAFQTSPAVLRLLGADVVGVGDAPDGKNINAGVGSEHPEPLAARVRAESARLGIAQDGDGDRCLLCDETGAMLDGDEILTILARHALDRGELAAGTLVVTVHSNLGVDAAVAAAGGKVVRAAVGDRYVAERMAETGATLGGESSGHIIFSDISGTGDGLVAALRTIRVMLATGRSLSELRRALRKFPQASTTVPAGKKRPLAELPGLSAAIRQVETDLGSSGRVLVRYSGTEPILRLLVEGPDEGRVKAGLDRLVAAAKGDL